MKLEAKVGAGGLHSAINSFGHDHNYTKLVPDFSEVNISLIINIKLRLILMMDFRLFHMKRDLFYYITSSP